MFDRAVAIIGIALAIIAYFSPFMWPTIPNIVAQIGIGIGILLFGLAIGLLINKRSLSRIPKLAKTANIDFICYGDKRTPKCISFTNIWRWFYLRNFMVQIDKNAETQNILCIPNLFISFEVPIIVGTLEVNSPDFKLPTYEVKEFNSRFAIIVFLEDLPAGSLNISIK